MTHFKPQTLNFTIDVCVHFETLKLKFGRNDLEYKKTA